MSGYWLEAVGAPDHLPPLVEEPLAQSRPTPSLANTKPRRPRRTQASAAWDPTIDMYKDSANVVSVNPEPESNNFSKDMLCASRAASNKPRRSSLFALHTQKLPLDRARGPKKGFNNIERGQICSPKERKEAESEWRPITWPGVSGDPGSDSHPHLLKKPRRRTIYIAPDDTTISTIHPGTSLEQHNIRQRKPRRSTIYSGLPASNDPAGPDIKERTEQVAALERSLTFAPRKAPLQQATKLPQTRSTFVDVPGAGTGKENVPPDTDFDVVKCAKNEPYSRDNFAHQRTVLLKRNISTSSIHSIHQGIPLNSNVRNLRLKPGAQTRLIAQRPRRSLIPSRTQNHFTVDVSYRTEGCRTMQTSTLTSSQLFALSGRSSAGLYPILTADVIHQELYDDTWLSHQETAITEMINTIFEAKESQQSEMFSYASNSHSRLLEIYQEPAVLLLHRRLQASLTFGALSISKDALGHVGRIRDDLQQRQRFLDFWTKTYNLDSLQAAVETVIGRTIPGDSDPSASSSRNDGSQGSRLRCKAIEEFLRVFLVRNEDVSHKVDRKTSISIGVDNDDPYCVGSKSWSWRRTALRSLMIVLLLDKGQKNGRLTGCLFQRTSPFKSSAAALQALGNLLLPSIGDINRVLDYLSYQVSCVQSALEEHVYRIENIAVDLRDGVLLARLVEILVSAKSSSQPGTNFETFLQHSAETPSPQPSQNRVHNGWALSQRLNIPCASRVQKLHNVQVVLRALQSIEGLEMTLRDVTAEDIVDGYREKNIVLMWAIFTKWGLDALLDFSLVEKEICRLEKIGRTNTKSNSFSQRKAANGWDNGYEEISGFTGKWRHASLLKTWAQKVALSNGIVVSNLSTSFADGRVYGAIIAEYASCNGITNFNEPRSSNANVHNSHGSKPIDVSSWPIEAIIPALGCSHSFAALFHNSNTIKSAKTTIPLLAFLASRLLPASQPHFAAMSIQRAWRRKYARWMLRSRLNCAILARECAIVVRARERIVNAAIRLQRWWRRVGTF